MLIEPEDLPDLSHLYSYQKLRPIAVPMLRWIAKEVSADDWMQSKSFSLRVVNVVHFGTYPSLVMLGLEDIEGWEDSWRQVEQRVSAFVRRAPVLEFIQFLTSQGPQCEHIEEPSCESPSEKCLNCNVEDQGLHPAAAGERHQRFGGCLTVAAWLGAFSVEGEVLADFAEHKPNDLYHARWSGNCEMNAKIADLVFGRPTGLLIISGVGRLSVDFSDPRNSRHEPRAYFEGRLISRFDRNGKPMP